MTGSVISDAGPLIALAVAGHVEVDAHSQVELGNEQGPIAFPAFHEVPHNTCYASK